MKFRVGAIALSLFLHACSAPSTNDEPDLSGEVVMALPGTSFAINADIVYYSDSFALNVRDPSSRSSAVLAEFSQSPFVVGLLNSTAVVVRVGEDPAEVFAVGIADGAVTRLGTSAGPVVVDGESAFWLSSSGAVQTSRGDGASTIVTPELENVSALAVDENNLYVGYAVILTSWGYADATVPVRTLPKTAVDESPVELAESGGAVSHIAAGGGIVNWYSWNGPIRRRRAAGGLVDLPVGDDDVTDMVADAMAAYAVLKGGTLLRIEADSLLRVATGAAAPLRLTPEWIYFSCTSSEERRLCRRPR